MKYCQKGQVLPILLVVIFAVLVILVVSYNASRATIAKMELINAADGAAYSGALQAARSMNFMAYTSRGMISNTIASGYTVAYVSQLRHLAATVDEISRPRQLLAKIASYASGSFRAQGEGLSRFRNEVLAGDVDDPELEPLLAPEEPRSDDVQPDPDADDVFQSEAERVHEENRVIGGNKFQRAGRFGGAVLDNLATTLGYATIPLTDMLNTAYAGIQMAEYAAVSRSSRETMAQVAGGYGADIILGDDNVADMYAWMLPVRPGLDGFGLTIPKTFNFNLGQHIRQRAVSTGTPLGGIAGLLSGFALGALDGQGALGRKKAISLSPMDRLIGDTMGFEEKRFMKYERAWRACFQMLPVGFVPLAPIPVNPAAGDVRDVYVTPPCTPPFVPPALPGLAQVAIDKAGGASFTMVRKTGSESGRKILEKRGGLSGNVPGNTFQGVSGQSGASTIDSGEPLTGTIADISDRPGNQAQRAGNYSNREYSELSDRSPMREAARQSRQPVIERFRSRLYASDLGQRSGASGLSGSLAEGAAWGGDWQSEDKIEVGAFVWRPAFKNTFPFIDVEKTLFDSKFDLKGNELAWGGATAKEFWPGFQGVPLYMALAEIPWTEGLSLGLSARQSGRMIEAQVLRPVTRSSLTSGFVPSPPETFLQARAGAEVFYNRQPHDSDNPAAGAGGKVYGYFPEPGVSDSPASSAFARLATDGLTSHDVNWFALMKNWYGQKWANTQISYPIKYDLVKPVLGISKDLPNLLTPFWDARLARIDM